MQRYEKIGFVGYDQLMLPAINNIPVLIIVLVPVAILAMRLAEKTLKKS